MDLTEPWKKAGTGGAGGLQPDAEFAIDGASQTVDGGGALSAFDGDVIMDGPGSGGLDQGWPSETRGVLEGGLGGAAGALDTAAGGSGGSADAPIGGAGGSATGGTSGARDAGTGGTADASARGTGGTATGGATVGADARRVGTGGTTTSDASVAETGRDSADATSNTVPSNGLVIYYPCEQTGGTVLTDLSGKQNHGTLMTMPAGDGGSPPPGFAFEPGKFGNALTLYQAGSGYVSMPAAVFKGAAELTIATWIKVKTPSIYQRVFDIGINANLAQNPSTGSAYITFYLKDNSNLLGFSSTKDGHSNAQRITANAFSTGVWKHLAVVLGPGGGTLYVDGASAGVNSATLPPQALGAFDYAFIGRSQFTSEPLLDGQIDEFRVYNRALSAGEVQALFQYAGP